MMRIEGRAARARRSPARASGARRAIQGEPRPRLAGELSARVVLRHELHIARLEAPVCRLVLDAEIRQLEVPINHGQLVGGGKGLRCPRSPSPSVRPVGPVQKRLVLALQFVVEDDARDAAAFVLQIDRPRPDTADRAARRAPARAASRGPRDTAACRPVGAVVATAVKERLALARQHDDARRLVD